MKNKKKRKVLLLVLLLLAVSIGFAALSTTLKIIGTTNIARNTWNVHWENKSVNQNGVSTTAPTLSAATGETANTIATWNVTLNLPGDFYEFTINAVNSGTIDAMISSAGLTTTVVAGANSPSTLPAYIVYTVTYEDGTAIAPYHLLAKATGGVPTKEAYKVRVEFTDDITVEQMNNIPSGGYSYTFTTQATYVQADDNAIPSHPTPLWSLPQGKTADTLALGDEICLSEDSTQCFNFVRYDGDDVVMLSKYNLNVGWNAKGTATNKQDSDVVGGSSYDGGYGNVQFAPYSYWTGSGNVYNSNVQTVATDGEDDKTVAYYVEEYKNILQTTYGATIVDARLLTKNEAIDNIGCTVDSYDPSNNRCPTTGSGSFIINTTFWLGTASDTYSVWSITSNGYFGSIWYCDYAGTEVENGVRPVIVVAKREL